MGYQTDYKGEFQFAEDLTVPQLAMVKEFLGEDCRHHSDWLQSEGLTHVDLEFTDNFSGLQWDGSEKSYDMVEKVNMIIVNMREKYKGFRLTGEMFAQGEEMDDRWVLRFNEYGMAYKEKRIDAAGPITCPHCAGVFSLDEAL